MSLKTAAPVRASLLCAVVAGGLCAAPASASVANIFSDVANSEAQLGEFTGTLEYIAGAGQGTLNVSLTNTSSPANGGFITGFAFNIDSTDAGASATLLAGATHPFVGINNVNAMPYGMGFDAGAALGANWQGGGGPDSGIAVGATGVFSFDVTASDAAALTASSFALTGPYNFNFVVRFRGFNQGSDKVPAIPAPGTLALLGLGGLVVARRRR